MKTVKRSMMWLAALLPAWQEAWAASTAGYSSGGVLVALFVGFCVVIVAMQLVPTLLMLVGAVKGLCRKDPVQETGRRV